MCYHTSTDSLLSFGVSSISRILRRQGYTLNKIESSLRPDSSDRVGIPLAWTRRNNWTGNTDTLGEIYLQIRKGLGGLCLEIQYQITQGDRREDRLLRYDLVRKESNLKPGTFRYYFRDPYSQEESLCSKLYLLPEIGEFVPRSVLQSWGVLYKQQRRGKKDRYFSGFPHAPRGEELRYRKRYYRGKETPFWRRYVELSEEEEYRWGLWLIGENWTPSLGSPEIAQNFLQEYRRVCGRKSSTRRKKVR